MLPYPLELTPGDFDAYLPERASSNAFSRPRLEFKQRALGWARHVVERLSSLEIDMDLHGSDEHPSVWNGHRVDCQWVFFWRTQEQRAELDALLDRRAGIAESLHDPSPYYRHAFLALRVDALKVEVSAQVHPDAWVDFKTFEARLASEQGAQTIVEAIAALPEQFQVGISGREAHPVSTIDIESLRSLAGRIQQEAAALWIGWSVDRELALQHADTLDEQLDDALIALAPVYQQLAWSEDDDPAELRATLDRMRTELAEAAAARSEQDKRARDEKARVREEQTERSRERTKERLDYETKRPRPTLADLFKPGTAAAEGPKPKAGRDQLPAPPAAMPHGRPDRAERPERTEHTERSPRKPREGMRSSRPREGAKPAPQHAVSRPRPLVAPTAYVAGGTVEKGAEVRVLSGPFAGKVGVIGEIDGRGGARVLLGLLSTKLLVDQLEAVVEAKDRPALQSSHRRNGLLGRSGK